MDVHSLLIMQCVRTLVGAWLVLASCAASLALQGAGASVVLWAGLALRPRDSAQPAARAAALRGACRTCARPPSPGLSEPRDVLVHFGRALTLSERARVEAILRATRRKDGNPAVRLPACTHTAVRCGELCSQCCIGA